MDDVTVAGSAYSAGDIVIGDLIGGANTWLNSTGIHIRQGTADIITIDATDAASPFARILEAGHAKRMCFPVSKF
jgi:hypothetical protein